MPKKGGGVQDPFANRYQPFVGGTQGEVGSLFGGGPPTADSTYTGGSSAVNQAFAPNAYQLAAGQGLTDPNSSLQGAFGTLGRAASDLRSSSPGAYNLLNRTIAGGFTDPTQNPFYNSLSSSATDAAQRFLNQNFDTIGGNAVRAGGGVAASSTLPEQQRRSAENVSSQLGGTLANIQSGIYGQERGFQNQALTQGLQLPFELSGAEQSLGTSQGNLELSRLAGLSGLGTQLAGQSQAGFQFPLDEALRFLALLRGVPVGGGGGLGGLFGGLGGLLGGIGSLGRAFGGSGSPPQTGGGGSGGESGGGQPVQPIPQ